MLALIIYGRWSAAAAAACIFAKKEKEKKDTGFGYTPHITPGINNPCCIAKLKLLYLCSLFEKHEHFIYSILIKPQVGFPCANLGRLSSHD